MPFADLEGCRTHYRIDGPADAPLLVLSNSLGTDLSLWDGQIPSLARTFRVLRYDTRGHGESSLSSEAVTVSTLAQDVLELVDQIGGQRFSFCGISLGGITGLFLAAKYPDRVTTLIASNTAANIGTRESWDSRIAAIRAGGMQSIVEQSMERWFTPEFRSTRQDIVDRFRDTLRKTLPEGYIRCCEAIRDADLRVSIPDIRVPALVIAGSRDSATTVEDAKFLVNNIPGAEYLELGTAHLTNVEAVHEFSHSVSQFLHERNRYSAGMTQRRAVLGDPHVDRSVAGLNDFNREFQDLITRYAWGEIWTRPGLPRHTRSLLTLAMMIALNRGEEFRMHVRAAFNNGVTRDEIKEVLLQAAIYCGVPAANSAFQLAREVFAEMEENSA